MTISHVSFSVFSLTNLIGKEGAKLTKSQVLIDWTARKKPLKKSAMTKKRKFADFVDGQIVEDGSVKQQPPDFKPVNIKRMKVLEDNN